MRLLFSLLVLFALPAFSQEYTYTFSWNGQYSGASCGSVASQLDGAYPIGGGATRVCTGSPTGAAGVVRACASTNMNICNEIQYSGTVVEPPANTCPAAGTSGGNYAYATSGLSASPTTYGNYDGDCVVKEVDRFCTGEPNGTYHCVAKVEYTGNPCPAAGCNGSGTTTPDPSSAPPKDPSIPPDRGPCQQGYYYGTVNGQTVCVPGQTTSSSDTTTIDKSNADGTSNKQTTTTVTTTGTSPNGTKTTQTTQTTLEQQWSAARQITHQGESSVPSSAIPSNTGETKTTTVTNSNGSKTEYTLTKNPDGTVSGTARDQNTVEKTETTTCTGSSCTVSNTTTTNGAPTGSTTGTTSKDGLCQSNPGNAQCGDGDGMFDGTCSAGFTCGGDAVQCAMAKKQHETSCALFENKSAESQLYDSEKGKTGDVTGSNPNNSTQAIGSGMFDYTSATGGGACITDKTITVMGRSIQLPFSVVCPWLDVLGNILVSVSSLVALRIVMRG